MSTARADVALAFLQAGFRGDDETAASLIGTGFTVSKHPEGFRASTVEELLDAAAGMRSWTDYEFDVERVIEAADGSAVVVQGTLRSTHTGSAWRGLAPTGRRITLDACYILGFDTEGRIISQDIYEDHLTVLEQIGIVELDSNEAP